MPVNQDFAALLRELSTAEARFLVVGAYAMAHHGRPRATGDIGLWVEPTPENATRVYRALASFATPLDQLTEAELTEPNLIFQIGVAPVRIDILTSLTALTFGEAWAARVLGKLGDAEYAFIGRADLIRNKRSIGRPRDLADVADLEGDSTA